MEVERVWFMKPTVVLLEKRSATVKQWSEIGTPDAVKVRAAEVLV